MGAEASVVKSYELGIPYEGQRSQDGQRKHEPAPYEVYPAIHKEDGSKVSIFIYNKAVEPKIGPSCAEMLKLVRHPNILKFIGTYEGGKHLKLITEDVVPLGNRIDSLETFEIISGIHDVLEGLIFLHEKVKLVHGNLSLSSLFVSNYDSSWKIGCMEKAEKFSDPGAKSDILNFVDLVKCFFNKTNAVEEQSFLEKLDAVYGDEATLNSETLLHLRAEPIFKNRYLETLKFLNSITMKTENEKKIFFSRLGEILRKLDAKTVARKLLPKLMSKMMLAEPAAEKYFIPQLWTYSGSNRSNHQPILPQDLYISHCLPLILKLLRSKQVHVRLILLKYVSLYVQAIDKDILEDDVLPLILIGLRDENDAIVTATFHGLAFIVPILGGAVVVGGDRKKYFTDSRPNITDQQSLQMSQSVSHAEVSEAGITNGKPSSRADLRLQNKQEMTPMNLIAKSNFATERSSFASGLSADETTYNSAAVELQRLSIPSQKDGEEDEEVINVVRDEYGKRHLHEESEADWEGFEAFSSGSESDEKLEIGELKAVKSAENLLSIAKDSLQFSSEPVESAVRPFFDEEPAPLRDVGSQNSSSSVSSTQRRTDLKVPKRLGEEFEFAAVIKEAEPDFFADMMPDLSKKTVLVEKKGTLINSKFEAVDDEAEAGWDTDNW